MLLEHAFPRRCRGNSTTARRCARQCVDPRAVSSRVSTGGSVLARARIRLRLSRVAADKQPVDATRVSAVVVIDTSGAGDVEPARVLIEFAIPALKSLPRRRTLGQVKEALLWCAFAWNY